MRTPSALDEFEGKHHVIEASELDEDHDEVHKAVGCGS
jgi:hypothetical protein